MRIHELLESDDHKTLYCSRKLTNGKDLVKWAKDQGFEKVLDPDDMHVTIAYSKKKIDWSHMTDSFDTVRSTINHKHPEKTKREVKKFDYGAVVLTFHSGELEDRWKEFIDDFGASWDYPEYNPHVTITYDGVPKGMKLEDIEPYQGPLEFGPEKMEPLNPGWMAKKSKKVKENLKVGELDDDVIEALTTGLYEGDGLYYLQPDGRWKKNADGRSKGRTRAEVEEIGGEIDEKSR